MNIDDLENIITLKGTESGPTSIILVGVHGNETCGIDAMEELLPTLQITHGTLYIGYGNPKAIDQQTRFFETNLNRMFLDESLISESEKQSYEFSRAQFLKTYLNQADALLDIHASNTPNSSPFIICESNSKQLVSQLPIQKVVYGFDKVQPGGTDYYMNVNGKQGICIECGYTQDPNSKEIAKQSIVSFLSIRKHVEQSKNTATRDQITIQIYEQYICKTNFKLTQDFADFENVAADQIVGTDGKYEIKVKKDSLILFARNRDQANQEAFLLGI